MSKTKKVLVINSLGKPIIRKAWRADCPDSGKSTLSWTVEIPASFSDDVKIMIKQND